MISSPAPGATAAAAAARVVPGMGTVACRDPGWTSASTWPIRGDAMEKSPTGFIQPGVLGMEVSGRENHPCLWWVQWKMKHRHG